MSIFKKKEDTIQKNLKDSFSKIKEEFEDHKEAINQNTNEIQSNYEYLCKLDSKFDKLSEKIDHICMVLNSVSKDKIETKKTYNIPPLTLREQEVFIVLYSSEKEISYKEIARRTALTENLVMNYITSLISKGVPIIKKYTNNNAFLSLEIDFKQQQTKENVLKINQFVSSSININ